MIEMSRELVLEVTAMVRRAGREILAVYGQADLGVVEKPDHSPLTRADLASHRLLSAALTRLDPTIPIVSEEGECLPWSERRSWRHLWLVDPLDGTKEFVKRNGEFTVHVALIEAGVPLLGIVHAPVLDRTYGGLVGKGAWRQDGDAPPRPIRATGSGSRELVVVASRSHAGPGLQTFLDHLPRHHLTRMGSSLKICLVAEGAADCYPRLSPTMEWDTAAPHAVVLAAGGELFALSGETLRYNKPQLQNPHFIAVGTRQVPWHLAACAALSATA